MEALIVGAIIIGIFIYNGTIDKKKFMIDNEKYLQAFREEDYTFLVFAKYGEEVDVDQLYMKRCTYAIVAFLVILAITATGGSSGSLFSSQFFLNLVLSVVVGVVMFKIPYMQL